MATVIFSHGFGVRSDARGMFTQIAHALPQHTFIFFDYNTINENGDIEVSPLGAQAVRLQSELDARTENVVLVAHSQGSVIAGMVDLRRVDKAILLAPPVEMSMQRVIDKLMKNPGAEIHLDGVSKLLRSDGSTTLISKEYIQSAGSVRPIELYERVASIVPTAIVRATEDTVLGLTNVHEVRGAAHTDMRADHDFTGEARRQLLAFLEAEI